MGPPGLTATPSERRSSQAVTRDTLVRDTHDLFTACGIYRSPSWVSTLVGKYRRSPMRGLPFGQFLAARVQLTAEERARLRVHPDYRRVIAYRDPTGETAVRHVMAARP
jgi:hypothetical protein